MTSTIDLDTELLALAESMLTTYKLAAHTDRRDIAGSQQPIYRATKKALITILGTLAGNGYRGWMLYSLWLDCGESIEYCYSLAAEANWRRDAFRTVAWSATI